MSRHPPEHDWPRLIEQFPAEAAIGIRAAKELRVMLTWPNADYVLLDTVLGMFRLCKEIKHHAILAAYCYSVQQMLAEGEAR